MKVKNGLPTLSNTPIIRDFSDIDIFIEKVQWFNALQFFARCNCLIVAFGENEGIELAERYDKYGLWFFLHQLSDEQRPVFYQLVFSLTKDTPYTEGV